MIRKPEAAARNAGTTNGPMIPPMPPSRVTEPSTPAGMRNTTDGPGSADGPLPEGIGPTAAIDGGGPEAAGSDAAGSEALGVGVGATGVERGDGDGGGAVRVGVRAGVGRGVGARVGAGVGTGVGQLPAGGMIVFVSRVTAPVCAKARPPFRPPPTPMVAPATIVMLVWAMRLPCSEVSVPIVAELVIAQNTAQPAAPRVSTTRDAVPVVSVDPILKMNAGLAAPRPPS